MFQLEQLDSSHINDNLLQAMHSADFVWDFSPRNVEYWQSLGMAARYLPLGIYSHLLRPPLPPGARTPLDSQWPKALFFGSACARRTSMEEAFRAAGVPIDYVTDFTAWGDKRDRLTDAAHVFVNVHCFPGASLEALRLVHALGRSKAVVSERSMDRDLDAQFAPCIVFAERAEHADVAADAGRDRDAAQFRAASEPSGDGTGVVESVPPVVREVQRLLLDSGRRRALERGALACLRRLPSQMQALREQL